MTPPDPDTAKKIDEAILAISLVVLAYLLVSALVEALC